MTPKPDGVAATLPEKLRQKAWLFLRRREATFEDEAAANLMLRAAKELEADRESSSAATERTLSVRVPEDLLDAFAAAAATEERTVSAELRLLIRRRVEFGSGENEQLKAALRWAYANVGPIAMTGISLKERVRRLNAFRDYLDERLEALRGR